MTTNTDVARRTARLPASVECGDKHPFGTFVDANRAARHGRRKHGVPLHAYRCSRCRHFHVGQPNHLERGERDGRRRHEQAAAAALEREPRHR